jgi:hypothetical protein
VDVTDAKVPVLVTIQARLLSVKHAPGRLHDETDLFGTRLRKGVGMSVTG